MLIFFKHLSVGAQVSCVGPGMLTNMFQASFSWSPNLSRGSWDALIYSLKAFSVGAQSSCVGPVMLHIFSKKNFSKLKECFSQQASYSFESVYKICKICYNCNLASSSGEVFCMYSEKTPGKLKFYAYKCFILTHF